MVAWNKTIQRISEEVLRKGNPMTTPKEVERVLDELAEPTTVYNNAKCRLIRDHITALEARAEAAEAVNNGLRQVGVLATVPLDPDVRPRLFDFEWQAQAFCGPRESTIVPVYVVVSGDAK